MSKYLLIMRGTDESNAAMMANIDEMMATTRQFIEEMVRAGVLLAAEGLDDPGQGVVVDFSGEAPVVTDGPYGETKELFGGFFLLDVASRQEAVEWAKRVPAAPGSKIEVRRVPGSDEVPQVEAVWRIESARIVAALTRFTRDFGLAEDSAQEAVAEALVSWPLASPANPAGWLMATARRRAIDAIRRRTALQDRYALLAANLAVDSAVDEDIDFDKIDDDVLALMFVSCHPVLSPEARVALTLRVVGGVLSVIYVIFTEGSTATSRDRLLRPDVAYEAIQLARTLAALQTAEPEVHGLLALCELTAARFPARTGPDGSPILLEDQDRRRWDISAVRRGLAALAKASTRGLGPYRLQAAIAATHASAPSVEATDWDRIVVLYEALGRVAPSPVVVLNRAVAVAMASGPAQALAIVDELIASDRLPGSHLVPTVRGELLARLGRRPEARAELELAARLCANQLGMAFPADRFTATPADEQLPLRLPPTLSTTIPAPRRPLSTPPPASPPSAEQATAPSVPISAGDLDLAVEVTRIVPASGNLSVCGQQFWLSPVRAGLPVTLWADTTVVHLLIDGVRLKTVPSRLTPAHLRQLLADDGQPAGPPPIATGAVQAGAPVEVERLVNATGLIGLAGRQHPVGYHFAGQRVTVRLDRGLMQITAGGVLLRSLPNPLTAAEIAGIRDARPAGPPPVPDSEPVRVERRVSCRGSLVIAGQRIHVGIAHAGRTLTVEAADTTFCVYDGDQLVTEVARSTTKTIARFKARKPEPARRAADRELSP